MPHKHKRRGNGEENYDLAPSTVAKPLPTKETNNGPKGKTKNKKSTSGKQSDGFKDDTPRAFARMMMRMQNPAKGQTNKSKTPLGLDDGTRKRPEQQNRKRKRGDDEEPGNTARSTLTKAPQILPGERLADFSARVDQALPLSGVSKKNANSLKKQDPSLEKLREERQTKHERRLRRMQREWREEEARIRQKEQAEREEREAENEEVDDLWKQWESEAGKKKRKRTTAAKKKKRKGAQGGEDDGEDFNVDSDDDVDPWAKLNTKARASRPINPLEVVQAPPQLVKPKEKFKVRGMGGARVDVANIPAAAGSLRQREELAGDRQSIVEQYRRLMAEKRG